MVAEPAARDLDRLPPKVLHSVLALLSALAANPRRLGRPLAFDLARLHSARRGSYRVIYEIDEEHRRVTVMAVGHRADIYRPR